MFRKILIPVAICVALAGVASATASAQGGQLASSWARLNACSATQLGARAQLAGDGSTASMSVSFTAQWLSPSGWAALDGAATSPSLSAGSAEYTWGQAGWTFNISVPDGFSYQLRALAHLDWSNGRSQTLVTGGCTISG